MRKVDDRIDLSASDLANHLGCRHLTQLDLLVARGALMPPRWRDPTLDVLQQRGLELEQLYLDHLGGQGLTIAVAGQCEGEAGLERTVAAMRDAADVVYQAALRSDRWHGRADFLRRVERPSRLGAWSYEVLDAKLARETRAGTILQLCLYSHMVGELQGCLPEQMHVVMPGDDLPLETFRVDDFLAYHRLVKRRLMAATDEAPDTYPEPVPQCDICRWWPDCDRRRRQDDHLCLVAGISKLQIQELRGQDVDTLAALAELPLPLNRKPGRGAPDTYVRVREQARIQLEGRRARAPRFETLPVIEGGGFCRLPEPSPGDVFLDLESDPFVGTSGLEYLLGWTTGPTARPDYHTRWAFDPATERAAFEAFIDHVMERWQRFPDLHIYHFTAYEPAALRRLMGRYATRESELDRLLRAERFVDLHRVARQAVRASVERYSLKDLEAFYRFERAIPVRDASLHLRALERAVELGKRDTVSKATLLAVEAYNRDDCISTMGLRDWLEELRANLVRAGLAIPRPELQGGDPSEAVDEQQRRVQELYDRLAGDLSPDPGERDPEQQARWLLANMLDWHRREKKATWWEYFRLRGLSDEELLEERAALAGLEFVERVATPKKSVVDRYVFPPQECEIREGDTLYGKDGKRFAKVETIDIATCTIDIRKGPSVAAEHRGALFRHDDISDTVKRDSLMRLGLWVAENGIDAPGPFRAARDLLLRLPPRPGPEIVAGEETLGAARRWVAALDHSVLPIQGPPGAGKTYTGARMITSLIRAGMKVGVAALSHKVIRNLLDEAVKAAEQENTPLRCVQKVNDPSDHAHASIAEVTDNGAILAAIRSGAAQVAAGTAWLWAREEFFEAVDVLFVDEAGQLTLADVLAVSQAAKSLVLLGDPQQLGQPLQGSHPEGTDVSALEYILGEHKTIPAGQGLFLEHTWRLHPKVCDFTSELFYEDRLRPRPNLERQVLDGPTPLAGAGLWFMPVPHEGNQTSSPEEVERVVKLVGHLAAGSVHWTDQANDRRPLRLSDILIIAPYNAQVIALKARLPEARIGTVDKFQGQEAPVVICSLTTSSPEEAPRGMEFLYSPNRLNVAVSRAKTACVLVGSPALFEPECRSPGQMRLANAFCRYLELARTLPPQAAA
jgi:uncharacterized protein